MYNFVKKNYQMRNSRLGLLGVALTVMALILIWTANARSSPLPTDINEWTTAAPLPEVLASRNAIAKGDRVYLIGGKNPTEKPSAQVYTAQVQADGSLGAWTNTTPLPVPVYLHAVAATDNYIYMIGGWDGSRTRTEVWRAPFAGSGLGAWEKISDYPTSIDLHDATIVKNRLYVVGGWTGTAPLSKVYYAEIQSTGLGAWTPALELPTKLYRLSVASANGFIYVTGGYDNSTAQSKVYYTKVNDDGSLGGWQQTTPLPDTRYYHETVVQDGKLVVLAGKNDTIEYNSVYAAVINANGSLGAWNAQPALPESLYRFAAVTLTKNSSNFIYLFGGLHNQEYRQNVYHSTVPSPPTPTSTPLPGPTSTPIPSISLQVQNSPRQWVAPGEEIAYTILYQNQGVKDAKDVTITGVIPADAELVPDSVTTGAGITSVINGTNAGDTIVWHVAQLDLAAKGAVGYRVRRLLAPNSGPQRALGIVSSGPTEANAGSPINYQITITNFVPITLTNVAVFDILPEGARYVGGANQSPVNNIAQWTVPTLAPDQVITLNLTVTAAQSLINSNYWVTAEEGASAKGTALVITRINNTPLPANGDGVSIINDQAKITWQTNGQVNQRVGNVVVNPSFPVFLPAVKN
ncbi:hypothetical protein BH10CHL1_BH10CHL1_04560 [soil metagenome]